MRLSSFFAASAALASTAHGLNILISNDDGFGTANIREMYKAVKAYGHNVYIVASSTDMSGQGGRAVFTTELNLTTDSEWGIIKKGAPSLGQDPYDSHIWYYNGTPAAQVFVALDYVLPKFADFSTPDLVLCGPNVGLNLGPFLYTLSGTMGATYAAVERGIPAVSFSAGYSKQTAYYWVNASTPAGLQDPATLYGRLAANLAQGFIDKAAADGQDRILPLGYGLSVNMPLLTSFTNDSCVNPPFVLTRMTGRAVVDKAVQNETTGLFHYADYVHDGVNQCINGDCSLPGETAVLGGYTDNNNKCLSSVSVFTVDYDAPYAAAASCQDLSSPYSFIPSIVQRLSNSTSLVGGLGANATVAGNAGSVGSASNATVSSSSSGPSASSTVVYSAASSVQWSAVAVGMSVLAAISVL